MEIAPYLCLKPAISKCYYSGILIIRHGKSGKNQEILFLEILGTLGDEEARTLCVQFFVRVRVLPRWHLCDRPVWLWFSGR